MITGKLDTIQSGGYTMDPKKMNYESPELHDLGVTEAIGACDGGGAVAVCASGTAYRAPCNSGAAVIPLNCSPGAIAFQKSKPKPARR